LQNGNAMVPLLGGIAAAERHVDLASLLFQGKDGSLRCAHCSWGYQYVLFGSQIALYADESSPPISGAYGGADSRLLLDLKEGAASRADDFIVPAGDKLAPSTMRAVFAREARAGPPASRASTQFSRELSLLAMWHKRADMCCLTRSAH
jgi:hypothetical protein